MEITSFAISSNREQLDLTIIDAAGLVSLNLFVNKDYKDYTKAIDLSSKLTASPTENITITLADINQPFFDGLYFIEATDDLGTISYAITADLTRYKECVLDQVLELHACDDCLKQNSIKVINAHTMVTTLETSVEQGFVGQAFTIQNALDKYCSNKCKTCGSLENVIDDTVYERNELGGIIDGGDAPE